MDVGDYKVNAGVVDFALQHRNVDGGIVGGRGADQGVSVQVMGKVDGEETELLRFDCFDTVPHYHYDPRKQNIRVDMDKTTAGNPLGWTLNQLRTNLPNMIRRAGYDDIADQVDPRLVMEKLSEVEEIGREVAVKHRNTVTHNRGDLIIEAGPIRFGLEFRELASGDRGQAIHVLADVEDQEVELLAFDCFEKEPHYHYGPRSRNERIFHDTTLVPNPLLWAMEQFKAGRLPEMINRAGYPGIVAELDSDLLTQKLGEVEEQCYAIARANNQTNID